MQFAPAIHPDLIRLVDELDDGTDVIAAIWRELGRLARGRSRLQPSYESVRRLVHEQRARRKLAYSPVRRAVILAGEFLWNTRDRGEIVLDAFDGRDIARRRVLYGRRPRDDPSRATPRGGA
jgi:hypothetical protein